MLALPKSRPSLLQSLPEAGDLYENPDTPGTTYSFQDPVSSKSAMHTESSHHLSASDVHMLVSTDDEMIDSDIDQRRDEDYDIDLDAEVYSVSGDLEMDMTTENDLAAYGSVDQNDNEDIILDDEPTQYYSEQPDILNEHSYSLVNQNNNHAPFTTEPPSTLEREEFSSGNNHEQSTNLTASDSDEANAPIRTFDLEDGIEDTSIHVEKQNESLRPSPSRSQDEANAPIRTFDLEDGIEDTSIHGEKQNELLPPSPSRSQDEVHNPITAITEQEEIDDSQSSTATLNHEGDGNFDFFQNVQGSENQTENPNRTDTSTQNEELGDSSYQYPIIVQYEQNRLTLFPSLTEWSEDPTMVEVYRDLPSDYLLPDVSVCEKPLEEVFMHLRDVLGPSVGPSSELILELPLLGLKICEDSKGCKSVGLRRILDLHQQLYENDGYEIALPVNVTLSTVPRFYTLLDDILTVVQEKKGLQEWLVLLNLIHANDYPRETDAADESNKNSELQQVDIFADKEKILDNVIGQSDILTPQQQDLVEFNSCSPTKETFNNSEMNKRDGEAKHTTDSPSPSPQAYLGNGSESVMASAIDFHEKAEVEHKQYSTSPNKKAIEDELLDDDDNYARGQSDFKKDNDLVPLATPSEDDNGLYFEEQGDPHEHRIDDVSPVVKEDDKDYISTMGAHLSREKSDGSPSKSNFAQTKPNAIPVYGDNANDYDNLQQSFDEYGYDESTLDQRYIKSNNSEQNPEESYNDLNHSLEHEGEGESYTEISLQTDGSAVTEASSLSEADHQGSEVDQSGNYQDEYVVQGEDYIEEVEVTEHDDYDEATHYEIEEFESLRDDEIESSGADTIGTSSRSPVTSIHEQEEEEKLIDYEEDEAVSHLHKSTSSTSLNTHKRLREDSNEVSDDKFDENLVPKRPRAE